MPDVEVGVLLTPSTNSPTEVAMHAVRLELLRASTEAVLLPYIHSAIPCLLQPAYIAAMAAQSNARIRIA